MLAWFIAGCFICLSSATIPQSSGGDEGVAEMDKTEVSNPALRTQQREFLEWAKRYPFEMEDAPEFEKRAPSRNPYSWMNHNNIRDKRSRNPYAWAALQENQAALQEAPEPVAYGWFRSMDKKSRNPYSWMNALPKRTRNPYSWMNFI